MAGLIRNKQDSFRFVLPDKTLRLLWERKRALDAPSELLGDLVGSAIAAAVTSITAIITTVVAAAAISTVTTISTTASVSQHVFADNQLLASCIADAQCQ
jgi:hypothetical protein